jgi:protein-disulfide isomerase
MNYIAIVALVLSIGSYGFSFFTTKFFTNPDRVYESIVKNMEHKQKKQMEDVKEKASKYVEKNYDEIIANSPVYGNASATNIIVQFSDYNCGYCKAAHQFLAGVVKNRPDIKIVIKELPILGQDSKDAAKIALFINSKDPSKYQAFHSKMLSSKTKESAVKVAVSLGFKESDVKAAIKSDVFEEEIKNTYKLAQELGIGGTPSFIIGKEFVPSFMPEDKFQELITKNFK